MKDISLNRRLTAALALTTTIIVLIVGSAFYCYTVIVLERQFSAKVEQTVGLLSDAFVPVLWEMDQDTANKIGQAALLRDFVSSLKIADHKERDFLSIGNLNNHSDLIRKKEIYFKGSKIGRLEVHFLKKSVFDYRDRIFWISISFWLLATCGITFITRFLILKYLREPIDSFTKLAQSYQDFERDPKPDLTLFKELRPIEKIVKDMANNIVEQLKRVKESENRFKLAMKFSSDGLFDWNLKTNEMYYSPGWKKMLGYEDHEIPNKFSEWERLTNPDDIETSQAMLNEVLVGKRDRFVKEFQMRHKEGFWVDILSRANVIFNDNKEGVRVVGTHVDISERKKIEKELQNSETKYRNMMESFADPLYICSEDFILEYMNPAMIRRVGRNAIGEKCHYALHGLDSKCDWCNFDQMDSDDIVETNMKSPLDGKNYRVANMPIQNPDGNISKMTILRDITAYLSAVKEKEKAQTQLLQSQKMESIGNLAGGIAHDFNNILSSIIGFTELALDEAPKGTVLEDSLQEVYSAGKRAKDLVRQILAFARQSDEKMVPVQPGVVAKEVLKLIRSTTPTTIEINSKIESESWIMGNTTQIHQILMNLFTNAAHAMEESGGALDVRIKDLFWDNEISPLGMRQGDYVEIKVSDTGVGIAPEIIESIYEPYFTTKRPGEGTGMGLAMVQGVIESYGGKIAVDSELGKGTTFKLYLPMTKKRSGIGAYVPEQIPGGTERVLFVDDEYPIAKIGGQMLERIGYSVTTRTSSIEALELFQAKPHDFDLVITDMTMPNLTGDKLAVELMKIRSDIPIILCTGFSNKASEVTALELGIKAFAYKPIVKADLAKTIRKALDEDL